MQLSHVLCFGFLTLTQGLWEATGWRLTPSVPTGDMGDGWTVREVQFYAQSGCGGKPIPHGSTIPKSASAIVDGRMDNSYRGCNPCKPHEEYVGYTVALNVIGTAVPTVARCLKIFQCYSSGCVPSLLLQVEADGQWRDATTFKTKGVDHWTTVELDFRPPNLPPSPPPPSPSTLPPPPPSVLSDGEASQGLSAGAIAGIAAGGAISLALLLGICGISVYVCRKMNRELEKAKKTTTEEVGAWQKSVLSPPAFATTTSSVGDLPVAVPEVKDTAIEMHPTS